MYPAQGVINEHLIKNVIYFICRNNGKRGSCRTKNTLDQILPCRNSSCEVLLHFGVLLCKKLTLEDFAGAGIHDDGEEAGCAEVILSGVYLGKQKVIS